MKMVFICLRKAYNFYMTKSVEKRDMNEVYIPNGVITDQTLSINVAASLYLH